MDIARIQREFSEAQQSFALVELRPTTDGKVYARTALQTVTAGNYVLSIKFPDSYPERDAARVRRRADDHPRAAQISGRTHLLPASFDVESRRASPDLRHRPRGEMAEQVRSLAQQRRQLARRRRSEH